MKQATDQARQIAAIYKEHREALEDENWPLVKRIMEANPGLFKRMAR